MAHDLYDRDFYAWTQAQAEALRQRGGNQLDYDNLAEEVDDMGKRDLRECLSRVTTILEHLWKLEGSRNADPRAGWTRTILTQRIQLRRALTPSLRRMVENELLTLHSDALVLAQAAMDAEEPGTGALDAAKRWTLAQILGEDAADGHSAP